MVRTKIIATLGPSTDNEVVLKKMFLTGLDVVRINFSHGTHAEHIRRIKLVRKLNSKLKRNIKIMQDLEGYRIRVGKLKKEITLKKKSIVYLTQEDVVGTDSLIPFDYRGSLRKIKKGSFIYIDDGKIILKVLGIGKRQIKCRVLKDGILKERKGINILGVSLEFDSLTEKDERDLEIAIKYKLDYVAQSFVRDGKDIRMIREVLERYSALPKIFAKIENREALLNIEEIVKEADGIIIARGDLGICLPMHKVPIIQKEIVRKCNLMRKPVVVATQMLESMIYDEMPTRAEVSDVANAILDGADMLLLSSETAVGRFPHKAVAMMNQIIKSTEEYISKLKELYL